VLAAILKMARALGLQTVAEGIETREQLAQLREVGCDLGQGSSWPGRWTPTWCPGTSTPGQRRPHRPVGGQVFRRRTEVRDMTTVRTALAGALLLDLGAVLAAPALSTRSTELAAALLAPAGAVFAVAASRALSSWIDAAVARVDR
jgi:EAL domain-containing protein (putative c-di-GMP-specific phosphodiesterase class I)